MASCEQISFCLSKLFWKNCSIFDNFGLTHPQNQERPPHPKNDLTQTENVLTQLWNWSTNQMVVTVYIQLWTKNSNLPAKSKFCNNSCRTKNVMSRRGFWDPWGFWVTLALVWFGLLQSELGKVWWVCFEMLIAWETQKRRENSNFLFFCAYNWATPVVLASTT